MKRIVLAVQYDGSSWHGWQTQPQRHTVQDRLEAALHEFTQCTIQTTCAGRTDSGVHALQQIVHFDTPLEREMYSWVRGLNALLPSSIAVRWAFEVRLDAVHPFHARFSAHSRTYQYLLYNAPIRAPLLANRAGWVFRRLNLQHMQLAANYLIGEHDFSAFRSSQCQAKSPQRHLYQLQLQQRQQLILITLRANGFLHHMVRNIVGSLIQVGVGRQAPVWIDQLLQARDRTLAAPTFMADGLYLTRVDYDPIWQLPQEAELFPW